MIEFQGVYKNYGTGAHALEDVNLHIDSGEFVFVVGTSGAGKSTFLKLIMREETPSAGEVIVNNYRLSRLKRKEVPYFRRTMGIVFQDFRLINTMTVFDNVAFSMRVVGKRRREIHRRVNYVLQLLGLEGKAKRYPLELSGGEQQRVGLARALVNNPSLIIADEPTGNVDPRMSHDIVDMLTQINEKGTTVLMVTHDHDLVREFGHRVVVLDKGHVVADSGRPTTVSLGEMAEEAGGEPV
ncbi:MAG: cell division ATP-binding protein FtsE [Ruminococcaceae bacterium]|nr:cell division ATP-binding protein FtsE [Oscillospiraceae bacterium]